ncbi:MAG: alpha/beta fold hydrolase [Gammaproteobacteria bacterium]|jgi:alpha/beta superfamily hydrolase
MSALYRDEPWRPPRPEEVEIPGPAGPLEAVVEDPAAGGGEPPALAVVCHPHPLYEGTMRNKVVHTLARTANRLGAPSVRFNFRGVGASSGAWDEGRGETEDVLAVIEWARRRWPGLSLWLAGFSFGSYVALRAAAQARPAALVTVAPPVQRFPLGQAPAPGVPWLVVQGEDDELVDARAVRAWAETRPRPPELALLPATSHFFHGRLNELQLAVQGFLQRVAKGNQA